MIKSQESRKISPNNPFQNKRRFSRFIRKSREIIRRKMLDQTLDLQEIQTVLINTKLINDIYSKFSDLSKTINKLEQIMKKSFAEQRTALMNEVLQILNKSGFEMLTVQNRKFMSTPGQVGMILNEDEINNIPNGLDQNKITITNIIIQLLYDKC